jgi:hypothetical protein
VPILADALVKADPAKRAVETPDVEATPSLIGAAA